MAAVDLDGLPSSDSPAPMSLDPSPDLAAFAAPMPGDVPIVPNGLNPVPLPEGELDGIRPAGLPLATVAEDAGAPESAPEPPGFPRTSRWSQDPVIPEGLGVGPIQVLGGVPARPSGFVTGSYQNMAMARLEDLTDGLGISVQFAGTYDSNPSLGYGSNPTGAVESNGGGGDFFLTLGGNVSYQSKASALTFGVNYSGGYNQYFSQSELSGYNQSLGGNISYQSGPLYATLALGLDFGSGANRDYGAVVDELSYSYALSGRYRLSPKTSLTAGLSQRFSSSNGGFSDLGSFDSHASALWKYSPLTEIGPGIRYSMDSSESGGDRTTIGPILTVNYRLSRKVSFSSTTGLDFSSDDSGGSADPSVSTSVSLSYRASSLWGMNLSLNRDVQGDPSVGGGFTETTAFRVGYNRKIRRAGWNCGFSYVVDDAQTRTGATNTTGQRGDRDYVSIDTSLGMPMFKNTCSASVFARFSNQESNRASDSWGSFQTGFGFSRSF